MNTKNIFKTLVLAAVLVSACGKNEIADDFKGYTLPVTINVSRQGDEPATRATYNESTRKLSFSAGDKLFVNGSQNNAGKFAGTLDYDAGSGKFSGTMTTENEYTGTIDNLMETVNAFLLPAGYESYGFYSVSGSGYEATVTEDDTKAFALTKAAAVEQFSFEQTISYSSGFALAPMNAIVSFTISGLTANKEVAVSFNASGTVISGKVTTNATGVATFAVGVYLDCELENCTLTVDGNNIALPTKTTEAGHIYNISRSVAPAYTLLSAATTSDYGKVVCAAGHLHDVKTAVPTGCTAVGILGNVTETGHGLILALHDAMSQTWETINGWTSETTYAGTTLKVLPNDAARGANLTSYTALGTTAVSNWAVAQKSDYEAIFINLGSTTGDGNGKTYDANVNAFITTGVGGTAISGYNWSATEIAADRNKWGFNSDSWFDYYKSTNYSVRPVLGFGGEAAPAGPTAYTLAESTVGMIVGTDGKAYAAADKDNLPSGVTAVAMVAYKFGSHGLAIQLNNSPEKMNWADANTYAEGLTEVPGGTWCLPSQAYWQYMFVGCAVSGDASASNEMDPIAGFKAKIAATGITWKTGLYWSSSTESSSTAWIVSVNLGDSSASATFTQLPLTSPLQPAVLACLAF